MFPAESSSSPPASPIREYGRTRLSRISAYVLQPAIGVGIIAAFLYYIRGTSPGGWSALVLALLIILIGCWVAFGFANAGTECFTLAPNQLEYTDRSGTRTYAPDDIASYSTNARHSVIYIHFKDPTTKDISFGSSIERYREIEQWLAACCRDRVPVATPAPGPQLATAAAPTELPVAAPPPDEKLVAARAKRERIRQVKKDLLANPDIGVNGDERLRALTQAQRIARWLNGLGVVTGLYLWMLPEPTEWSIMAGLVVPLVAVGTLWWYPRLLRLDGSDENGYPTVMLAIGAPIAGLWISSYSYYEVLAHGPLWPFVAAVALLLLLLLVGGSRRFLRQPDLNFTLASLVLAVVLLYSYIACAMANVAYDTSAGQVFNTRVLSRSMSHSKYQDFYTLKLSAWGPVATANESSVSYHVYKHAEEAAGVCVVVHPGFLGMPWYRVELVEDD